MVLEINSSRPPLYQLIIHTPAVNKFVDTSLHVVGPGGRMAENRVKDQWIAGSNPLRTSDPVIILLPRIISCLSSLTTF